MKKISIISILALLILKNSLIIGQGLQNIIIEQIPVPAAAISQDANLNSNSVTYRVFVDMAEDYYFESVLGTTLNPLVFNTTTQFYNNSNGAIFPFGSDYRNHPSTTSPSYTMNDPFYYDSWITIGSYGDLNRATSRAQLVLRSEDTDGVADGIVLSPLQPQATLDPATDFEPNFGYIMGAGFSSENVIWYAAGGVSGITSTNTVCIGQFTTDGEFTMELSVRIGKDGVSEHWVAREKIASDQYRSDLLFYPVNHPPSVTVISPLNGSLYNTGDSVAFEVSATDADLDNIDKIIGIRNNSEVYFWNNAPYKAKWKSTGYGTFEFKAVAKDERGSSDTSDIVTFYLNSPPQITIDSPLNSEEYYEGDSVLISADVSDVDDGIAQVEFFINNNIDTVFTNSPFRYKWKSAAGPKNIYARATDTKGAVTISNSVDIDVKVPDNNPPFVSVLSPDSFDVIYVGQVVAIEVNAFDTIDTAFNDTISYIDFYVNGTLLGRDVTRPFIYNWTCSGSDTAYITAIASDSRAGKDTSGTIPVLINRLPSVTVLNPLGDSEAVYGEIINIAINTSDPDAIDSIVLVEYFINNNKIAEDNSAPFSYNWTANVSGPIGLNVQVTDSRGAGRMSSTVNFTVLLPPVITFTSPENGDTVLVDLPLLLTTNTNNSSSPVSKVTYKVNNILLIEDNIAPFQYNWVPSEYGIFEILSIATDEKGLMDSAVINVLVNIAPEVYITSPAQNAEFADGENVQIIANASDVNGNVEKVEFFVNGLKIGEKTSEPFEYSWLSDEGNAEIYVIATDNHKALAYSDTVNLLVTNILHINNEKTMFTTYPNPVNDMLYIMVYEENISGTMEYSITDISGKIVSTGNKNKINNKNNEIAIDVSTLPPGTYIFNLKPEGTGQSGNVQIIKK